MVSERRATIGGQATVISERRATIGGQATVVSERRATVMEAGLQWYQNVEPLSWRPGYSGIRT